MMLTGFVFGFANCTSKICTKKTNKQSTVFCSFRPYRYYKTQVDLNSKCGIVILLDPDQQIQAESQTATEKSLQKEHAIT